MKLNIEKNRLDLAYQRQLQLLNFVLIVGVGSIISLIIGIILNPEKLLKGKIYYGVGFIMIVIIIYSIYYNINKNLKGISNKIKALNY